jgi:hypothetical protein
MSRLAYSPRVLLATLRDVLFNRVITLSERIRSRNRLYIKYPTEAGLLQGRERRQKGASYGVPTAQTSRLT